MASILDYLDWRGDITFAERPFNEVDNLLLAELSYLDFGGIVPADFAAAVPLSDAVAAFTKRTPHADMGVLVPDKIPGLAQKMAASARFRDVLLSGYVCKLDEQTETQFAALCAALPDGTVYAAFRGTDDTIVGWKEDFNMGFLPICAVKYSGLNSRHCGNGATGRSTQTMAVNSRRPPAMPATLRRRGGAETPQNCPQSQAHSETSNRTLSTCMCFSTGRMESR